MGVHRVWPCAALDEGAALDWDVQLGDVAQDEVDERLEPLVALPRYK